MVALGVVAVRYRWGVVALRVVAEKETEISVFAIKVLKPKFTQKIPPKELN